MKRASYLLYGMANLALMSGIFTAKTHSSELSEPVAPFHSLVMSGSDAGTEQCVVCQFEDRPGLMVFTRLEPSVMAPLIQRVEQRLHSQQSQGVQAAFVFLRGTSAEERKKVKAISGAADFKKTIVALYSEIGPTGWNVDDKAKISAALVKSGFVFSRDATEETSEPSALISKALRSLTVVDAKPHAIASNAENAAEAAAGKERHYWIQLENRDWNLVPSQMDRLSGFKFTSPAQTTFKDALVYRRYKPPVEGVRKAWEEPDDRRVNPWDMNEPDPRGGTIPGPVIECNVGDRVVVHFRNLDCRERDSAGNQLPFAHRVHSMHVHGIVFSQVYDGAYPLSAPDPAQPVNEFNTLWEAVMPDESDKTRKMGDRVPPGCTFEYRWDTFSWPSTAGVWLYHDHSIHDMDNVLLGAIGVLIVHNPDDPDDVFIDFDEDQNEAANNLPGGTPNGGATFVDAANKTRFRKPPAKAQYIQLFHEMAPLVVDSTIQLQELEMMTRATSLPRNSNKGQVINGRKFLGNTPTVIAGRNTKMRFGVIGMNNNTFHTFHLHGHRWVVPGPSRSPSQPVPTAMGDFVGGETSLPGVGVQNSLMTKGVSQFEDTKIFGPANSFSFTINQGSFMGPPLGGAGALGEWHMHCHVLSHMSDGMMGSLLIIDNTEPEMTSVPRQAADWDLVSGKTVSVPGDRDMCKANGLAGPDAVKKVVMNDDFFEPAELTVELGSQIIWQNEGDDVHTATANDGSFNTEGVDPGESSEPVKFETAGEFQYRCLIHGSPMSGKIIVKAPPSQAAAQKVLMKDDFYDPEELTVEVGTSVIWQNDGDATHTATANDGSFNTEGVDPGESSEPVKFETAGEFQYRCLIHGSPMSGKIIVKAPPSQAAAQKVLMKDDFYDPEELTVEVGTSVIWQNDGDATHTATANDGSFNTEGVDPGESSEPVKFETAGEFQYRCLIHGSPMSGKIIVKAPPSQAAAQKVLMKDDFYDPEELTVEVGTSVIWQNDGDATHTATANDGSFNTEGVDPGESSEPVKFETAGEFQYRCLIHGSPMSGKIIVTSTPP